MSLIAIALNKRNNKVKTNIIIVSTCEHCVKPGHIKGKYFQLIIYLFHWVDSIKWFNCGETGHIKIECPKLIKKNKENEKKYEEDKIKGLFIGTVTICEPCDYTIENSDENSEENYDYNSDSDNENTFCKYKK